MKNKAFTLIELLVVVLIIGILAAIAVPQYQYSVLKSKYHTLMNMAKAIKDAEEVYYLANGKYATHFSELDISVPQENIESFAYTNAKLEPTGVIGETVVFNNGEYKFVIGNNEQVQAFWFKDGEFYMDYDLALEHNNPWGEGINAICVAWAKSGDLGVKLCKDLAKSTCNIRKGGRSTCRL